MPFGFRRNHLNIDTYQMNEVCGTAPFGVTVWIVPTENTVEPIELTQPEDMPLAEYVEKLQIRYWTRNQYSFQLL